MIILHYGKKEYGPMPGSYNELSGDQLIAIAGLFINDLPEEVARLKALKILLSERLYSFARIPADAKERMLEHVEWVFEKNKLTEQVLPAYDGFCGPKKEFDNLTISEFHFTEIYYRQFAVEKDDDALNKLVAVLYRKPKPDYNYELDSDGDARERFNSNETNYYARLISGWPMPAKLAILFFYDGCRQNLLDNYAEIFKGDGGDNNDDGMFGIIRGLSGDKYGDIDKVEVLNIHTALYELTLQLKEAEKLKQPTT